jgi:hypothetical protein
MIFDFFPIGRDGSRPQLENSNNKGRPKKTRYIRNYKVRRETEGEEGGGRGGGGMGGWREGRDGRWEVGEEGGRGGGR